MLSFTSRRFGADPACLAPLLRQSTGGRDCGHQPYAKVMAALLGAALNKLGFIVVVSRLALIIGLVGLADFEADLGSSRSNDRHKHQTGHHDAYGRRVGRCRTPGWLN